MSDLSKATFDKGGILPASMVLIRYRRRDQWLDLIAMKAWVGRTRRVGLSHWSGSLIGLPVIRWNDAGVTGQVYRHPGGLKWIRIPGTGWCLSTYRKKR